MKTLQIFIYLQFCLLSLLSPTVPPRNADLDEILFRLDTDEVDGFLEESYLVIDDKGRKLKSGNI